MPPHTQVTAAPVDASRAAARSAGLRWVSDAQPGLTRQRVGKSFRYRTASGRPASARETARIRALAIPPAWTDVWICPDPDGHIQATGRDAKGRKQYRYHPRWRAGARRDQVRPPARLRPRAARDPGARCERDLVRRGLPREKVLATVVRLLEKTLIRVGNEEYARANRSFGLTTLTNRHVKVRRPAHRASASAASRARRTRSASSDRELARIVKRCQDLPGQELFQYLDAGGHRRARRLGRRQRYLRRGSPAGTSRPRTSAPGPAPCARPSRWPRCRRRRRGARARRR